MRIKPPQTMTQAQAKLGVFACGFIILAVYFFEYSGVEINKHGAVTDVVGKLTHCSHQRVPDRSEPTGSTDYLFIDSTGNRAYSYRQPKAFRDKVAEACQANFTVKLVYRPYQPLLKDWTGYKVLALEDITNNKPIFTFDDYRAWKEENRFYANIVLIFTIAALIYLFLVWQGVIGKRDVERVKSNIRLDPDDGDGFPISSQGGNSSNTHLLVSSRERKGESWAYLFLFSGLTVWFTFQVYTGKHIALLLISAVFLIAAYAYLVEVVNTNYLSIDDEYLITFSKPLPWIQKPVILPIEDIDCLTGGEEKVSTSQGNVIQYAVSVKLKDGRDAIHLFFTRDLGEAEAVIELANEKLAGK